MTSSFEGSAIEALVKRAESLAPNFSSKPSMTPSDAEMFPAPPMMGKFLALKHQLEQEEKFFDSDESVVKDLRADQSLCAHLANRELRVATQGHPLSKDMTVRNNGSIVIMRRCVTVGETRCAMAAE